MRRRTFLAGTGGLLATPNLGYGAERSVLRFVPYVDLGITDPVLTTAITTRNFAFMVFDSLYALDADYVARPEMVAGHTMEDGGRLWTLTLRDGLFFHDGTPVLARDAVASLRRWGQADATGRDFTAAVAEMAAPTDRVIRIRFRVPYPHLPEVLGKVAASMPAIMPERLAATDAKRPVAEIVGSGPFRFVANERVPGSRNVFERFERYQPRADGVPGQTAGPKVVNVDRVEWITIPDPSTAAAALQAGEIDWWETPNADIVPTLRKDRGIRVQVHDKVGVVPVLRFNCLQPPFDNAAIRTAVMLAASQTEFMQAVTEDSSMWRVPLGLFPPGTPMASEVGLERFKARPDLDAARRAIAAAGYRGEKVVVLNPTDHPVNNVTSQVGADLFRRLGLNVDLQAMDAGTLFQRRNSRGPVDKGGWSVFPSMVSGPDVLNPIVSFLARGNGADAWYGWPTIPGLETARTAWFDAADVGEQKRLAEQMQLATLDAAPHIPLGQILPPTAYRSNISGVLDGIPKFWNLRKG